MRKIIVSEFISVDGVFEDPGGSEKFEHGGWTTPYWSDNIGSFKQSELEAADTLLLGRITYEGFARVWPDMDDNDGFAVKMNNMPKYVVSQSLVEARWKNSQIIRDEVAIDGIKKLKQSAGQDILIFGSGELVRSLLPLSLIDEFRLLVYPVVLGSGKQLFGDNIFARLNLIGSTTFPKGVLLLNYDLNLKEI